MARTLNLRDAGRVVEARLDRLRKLADGDSAAAVPEAWAWFRDLGARTANDRDAADAELSEIFRSGRPASTIDGPAEGMLVAPLIHPVLDRALRVLSAGYMPWLGKRFDAISMRGDNRLVRSARPLSRLLWPTYAMTPDATGWRAFDFETRIEPGALDPGTEVLVIDYGAVEANPRLLIRQIRDELVEIVPGAYLGRVLWASNGSYTNIGWFALKTPVR